MVKGRGRHVRPTRLKMVVKFTCGDTVQLHSGGPPLTVINPAEGNTSEYFVRVAWFDQALALHDSLLPQDCLKLVQSVPSAPALGAAVAGATEKSEGYVEISES